MKQPRYIDAQGRVIIPAHMRKALNLTDGKMLSVELREDGVIEIMPAEKRCVFCGKTVEQEDHITIGEKYVCASCAQKLREEH